MAKKKATSGFKTKVCACCGEKRKDCKVDQLSKDWICATCQTGAPHPDEKSEGK